jgi:hypothetical protein
MKFLMINSDLNEVACMDLIYLIDFETSDGKIAFNLVKGYKTKDHSDCNVTTVWERFKKKYEPISAPSMVKLEKRFRGLSLNKLKDPEVRITEIENLCIRLEDMGSAITDNQFMIHV